MALYIDASALVSLIVAEPDTRWAETLILTTMQERLVSDFGAAEVASAISKRVRMGATTPEAGEAILLGFDEWSAADTVRVETTAVDIAEAARLVRRFELKLRAPDALHLALVSRLEAELVTRDRGMIRAAEMIGLPRATPA